MTAPVRGLWAATWHALRAPGSREVSQGGGGASWQVEGEGRHGMGK